MPSRNAMTCRTQVQSVSQAQVTGLEQVVACTNKLVELALQANWPAVLDGIDARRRLLQTLIDQQVGEDPQVAAMSAAVSESERALMRVVAHAIASSQRHGAHFAMYH